jgi:cytochrome c peroxidase
MNRSKNISLFISLLLLLTGFYFSCKKKETAQIGPRPIEFKTPQGWPNPQYDFSQNPLTEEGFALGKKIFYDNKLSSDEQVACANCHQHTSRASQSLVNLAWHKEMTWDGGVNHIEVQPLVPFTHTSEMNLTMEQVLQKISANRAYKPMYKAAFGDETINTQRTLKALAQFMLMLVSNNSKYDKVKRGEASFTSLENLGYQVFQAKCNTCHAEPLFTDLSFRNIGLTMDPFLKDKGRMGITLNRNDSLKFKVPSLRNVALTQPYTHDGRYGSLDRMIDHYRNDVVLDFGTDPIVRNRLSISPTEKAALVTFLTTLTDTTFTKNPKFAQ